MFVHTGRSMVYVPTHSSGGKISDRVAGGLCLLLLAGAMIGMGYKFFRYDHRMGRGLETAYGAIVGFACAGTLFIVGIMAALAIGFLKSLF